MRQVDPRLRGVLHVGCKHAPHSAAADAASLGVADGVPICGGPDGALVAQAIPLDTHLQAGVGSQVQRRAQVLRADLEAQQRSCPAAVSEWTCSRTASRHRVRVWQQKSCGYAVGLQKGTESVSSSSCLVDMQPDGRQAQADKPAAESRLMAKLKAAPSHVRQLADQAMGSCCSPRVQSHSAPMTQAVRCFGKTSAEWWQALSAAADADPEQFRRGKAADLVAGVMPIT